MMMNRTMNRIRGTINQAIQPFRTNQLNVVMTDLEITVARLVALTRLARDTHQLLAVGSLAQTIVVYDSGELIPAFSDMNLAFRKFIDQMPTQDTATPGPSGSGPRYRA